MRAQAKPAQLTMTEAGTLPLVGLTSYQALALAGAPWPEGSNKTVVITSGAGGTGFLAVQMARAFAAGRIVTAAASVLPSSTPSRLPDPRHALLLMAGARRSSG